MLTAVKLGGLGPSTITEPPPPLVDEEEEDEEEVDNRLSLRLPPRLPRDGDINGAPTGVLGREEGVKGGSPPKAATDGRRRGGVAVTPAAAAAAGDGGVNGSRGAQFVLSLPASYAPAPAFDTRIRSTPASSSTIGGVEGSLLPIALPPMANAACDHLSPANALAALRDGAVLWRRAFCKVKRLCTEALRLAARWSASDFKQARESLAACFGSESCIKN